MLLEVRIRSQQEIQTSRETPEQIAGTKHASGRPRTFLAVPSLDRCDPDLHPRIRWVKRSVDSREYEEIRNQTVGESRVVSGGGDALGQAPASDDNRMFVAGPKERPRKPARDQDPIINEHERVRPFTFKVNSKPIEAVSTSTAPPPRTTKPTASATPGTAAPTPARTTSEAPRKVVRDALEVGKKLKSPLYDFYRLLRVENDSSSEVGKKEAWPELVRVPRGAAEREKKDKKRKQRNKWKKKGKKGQSKNHFFKAK